MAIESKRLPAITAEQSPPLPAIMQARTRPSSAGRHIVPLHKRTVTETQQILQEKKTVQDPLAAAQQQSRMATAPAPLINFEGISGDDNQAVFGYSPTPSDVNGDIGVNHYVQMVNNLYQIFDKQTGDALIGPFKLSRLFAAAGVTGACATEDQGDPIVLYDALANRWLLSQFNFKTNSVGVDKPPYHECIAISATDDPTGSYYVYDFVIPNDYMGDYPKFGVWNDGYYMTIAQYKGQNFKGEAVMVFDRKNMLQGKAAGVNYHNLASQPNLSVLLPSDNDGDAPPVGTPNYVIGFGNNMYTNKLRIFEVKADFSTATTTGSIKERPPLKVATFNPDICRNDAGNCIPQPSGLNGRQQKLDALSDRPLHRLQYRYFAQGCPVDGALNGCATLVFNHTVRGNKIGEAAVRWYLLKQNTATKALGVAQQGSFAPDSTSRWMGSAALNKRGDLAIGYSLSSSSLYPSVGYAGRLVDDAPNALTLEGRLYTGHGAQTDSERWGDYSTLSVDPVDDCTFWYTNQYYANNRAGFNWLWRTRIGSFKLSNDC